jgi:ABC-type branched-subunit amino acid transport system ATPase component
MPADPTTPEALRIENLTKRFGGVVALNEVSMSVPRGEITGLIGPNGSGKSTLFDVATGVVPRDSGHVWLDGAPLDDLPLDRIARRGLVRSFQVPRLAKRLTVLDHLMMAAPEGVGESFFRLVAPWSFRSVRRDEAERREAALEMLETLQLSRMRDHRAAALSGGQQKLLTLGVALMTRPSTLLLDEPVAGVNARIIDVIMDLLRKVRDEGVTILIIEHNMSVMWEICSTLYAMHLGRIIAHGVPAEMQRDVAVIDAYLGQST